MSKTVEYDSKMHTEMHIDQVRDLLNNFSARLKARGHYHDQTKLKNPEKEIFDEFTPKLSKSTYGSDEYKQFLKGMGVALTHHYENNRHHPEHFNNGIRGMNLIDIVEMLCDWKAATMRHDNGDLGRSIKLNQERFGYSDELYQIFINTADYLGWLKPKGE